MKRLKAIIIDDEPPCVDALFLDLDRYCPEVEVIAKCIGSKEGLKAIKDNKPDLVFLDIEMPWMNGFELIEMLDEVNFDIVFTTAYDQFAVRAFRISAVDYLLKPIDKDDLVAAVDKILKKNKKGLDQEHLEMLLQNVNHNQGDARIAFSTKEGLTFVAVKDILYCEADGNYTTIVMKGRKNILLSKPIKEVQNLLQDMNFCRIHNSYLINLAEIQRYVRGDGGYVIMSDDKSLSVSRTKKEDLLSHIQSL